MAEVQIRDARKSYGAVEVLRGVDVEVRDGEFVALVGPSGCGKSTLLRMIAGLEGISGGEIRIGARVVNDIPPKQRDVAMVFQNYALYPHMTVAKNMGFSLKLAGKPKDEIDRRVAAAAEILDLSTLLDRLPRQLSGGQRQRVAMGRAIVRNPRVFLFDEPLSNLDAKLRVQMRAEIKALHQRLGTTTVYVTHDQVEAMTMADKIVVMRAGVVEQVGSPLDLYDHPANMFVAGFIGSPAMNFIEGHIEKGRFISGCGLSVATGPTADTARAVLGIRPEHLTLDPAGTAATVVVVEQTGSETLLLLDMAGQKLTYLGRDRLPIRPGETVHILPDATRLHLFDPQSGHRLGDRPGTA
ncbi:ABC transporter ATP-binding protein [Shinella granuli]|uniref:Carbohydrate ABC transporter ATP-binding protein (CUT1 family) n=1 Tax=Shinella granuli TaxID=323621 RepID=A0A4V2RJ86_SHIGR|nr:sn-glycerol-3-phosphate ABC transporter ATP-binding protein UgpC [Shinella granuli]TCN47250.1 carbohydrate ABC transporter ATP-binding protein (CUT1 family) [Shinella granuli]